MLGVPWYVDIRYFALGLFAALDSYLWRWAVTSAPSRRRGFLAAARVGLVLVVATLLLDVLLPSGASRNITLLTAAQYFALGSVVMIDVIIWRSAVMRPPSQRLGLVAAAIVWSALAIGTFLAIVFLTP